VRVLEARTRVGGRMVRTTTPRGSVVDLGGQWGGTSHHRFADLLTELTLSTYPSHYDGQGVFVWQGRRAVAPLAEGFDESLLFFAPQALGLPSAELIATQRLQQAFADLVARVDPHQPWLTPDAARLDRLSVAQWGSEQSGVPLAQLPLTWLCRVGGSGGFEPWEASILHLAWTQTVAPQSDNPEAWLVHGGAGQIPPLLADALKTTDPGCVQLGQAVVAINQTGDGASVLTAAGQSHQAGAVIVALPPQLRLGISFDPPLPPAHRALLQRSPMGGMTKVLAIYGEPFWRKQGLNGLGIGDLPLLELTADSSPPEAESGVLASFVTGERALQLATLPAAQRHERILADLVRYWGPEAGAPLELIEQPWNAEPWSGGAFTSFLTPGTWTSHARLAAAAHGGPGPASHGRVLWAGTEASPRWPGYFEGAIEAGELAATEATALLKP